MPDSTQRSLRPASLAIHAGEHYDIAPAKPTVSPIHTATAFIFDTSPDLDAVFEDPDSSYAYARFGNPTVRAYENAIAAVEGAEAAIAFPSGMAAVNSIYARYATPGSTLIVSQDVYGATIGLAAHYRETYGANIIHCDVTDLEKVKSLAEAHRPSVIFGEIISNPQMKVLDIAALAMIADANGAILVIDNTFASPALCRPIEHGATITLHSSTKYINGHGDSLGGVIAGPAQILDPIRSLARINGSVPGPMDAWLTLRGLKTLHLRMREHSANARTIVEWLQNDPRIGKVNYPELDGEVPNQFLADDRGGMISFTINNAGHDEIYRLFECLEMIEPATTLGDVASMMLYPAYSAQRFLEQSQKDEWGISDDLVRLSVGIEDVQDIIADLDQALDRMTTP